MSWLKATTHKDPRPAHALWKRELQRSSVATHTPQATIHKDPRLPYALWKPRATRPSVAAHSLEAKTRKYCGPLRRPSGTRRALPIGLLQAGHLARPLHGLPVVAGDFVFGDGKLLRQFRNAGPVGGFLGENELVDAR